MAYSLAEKISILEYARDNGTIAAANHFGVASSTVVRWNRKYQIYETQTMRNFSVPQKIQILQYANDYGLINAASHYDIDAATLQRWNRELGVYTQHLSRHNDTVNKLPVRVSESEKIMILEYARDFGPSAAARTYNIAASTIRLWNNALNIYQTRQHRTFSPEQKCEIIAWANDFGIASAARQFSIPGFQIQDWINRQKQK